ncbi:MAG: ATP-binding cassette domain-containing protein [Bacilli bacterium]|nr:ATP-binding cassette domain-containing protein [Bacilli bacterium]
MSGGEKQRIILARALLNEFQILILDEALSELNNELEVKIIQNLKVYLKDKTVIYVSHKENEAYFDAVYDFKEAL